MPTGSETLRFKVASERAGFWSAVWACESVAGWSAFPSFFPEKKPFIFSAAAELFRPFLNIIAIVKRLEWAKRLLGLDVYENKDKR
jgi:hypothetical protein